MTVDPRQVTLLPIEDPSGTGQPCAGLFLQLDAGPVALGIAVQQHGGQLLRIAHYNPSPSDAAATHFELNSSGRIGIDEV